MASWLELRFTTHKISYCRRHVINTIDATYGSPPDEGSSFSDQNPPRQKHHALIIRYLDIKLPSIGSAANLRFNTFQHFSTPLLPRMFRLNSADKLLVLRTPRLDRRLERNWVTDDTGLEVHFWFDLPAFLVDALLDVECRQRFGDGEPDGRFSQETTGADPAAEAEYVVCWVWRWC